MNNLFLAEQTLWVDGSIVEEWLTQQTLPTPLHVIFVVILLVLLLLSLGAMWWRDRTLQAAIQARQIATESLRQQNERLERAEEHAQLGSWEFDSATGQGWWSPQMYVLLGCDPTQGVPSFEDYLQAIHPEDRNLVAGVLAQMSQGEKPSPQEFRSNPERGAVRYFSPTVQGVYDANGRLTKIRGTLLDVTIHQKNETARRRSEEKYRDLVEQMPLMLCTYLPDSTLTYVNPAYADYFAQTPAQLIGQRFLSFLPAHERANTQKSYLSLTPSNPTQIYEHPVLTPDATHGWHRWTNTAFFDEAGQIAYIQGIGRDISTEKLAELERQELWDQLQRQSKRVHAILDSVPEGMILLDQQNRILMANPPADRYLLRLAKGERLSPLTKLGQRPLAELLTSPPAGLWHELQADGRTFELIARPITGGTSGEQWVIVIKDVTQAVQTRTQISQQERLAAVGQLAAGIAHDFNNILVSILLYTQLLQRNPDLSSKTLRQLGVIENQSHRAADLIRQILDFSRRSMLERQPLDLLALLKENIKLLQRTLPENIELVLDYPLDHYAIHADPTRMQQLITNLAVNARDALPKGGIVRFELSRLTILPGKSPLIPPMPAGEWLQLQVVDNGTGIPPTVLPHIFEPFFTTKAPGAGSGLGLAQVYGIVAQHDGRLAVTTAVNEGTTFTIYLPALPITAAELAPNLPPEIISGQGQTILVVEDDAAVRAALVATLEILHYATKTAANGHEALVLLHTPDHNVSLVLSDVVMPKLGGIPLFHTLREEGLALPVILLTGHPIESELEPLYAQGLTAWLSKPPTISQLAQTIAEALNASAK